MAGKSRTERDVFGVRPALWASILLLLTAVIIARWHDDTTRIPPRKRAVDQAITNRVIVAPLRTVREPQRPATAADPAMHPALIGPDARENEPVSVLVNELFSPDADVRMTAALQLSRRSLGAREALPVLRKLVEDEPDAKVRQVMKEAILNIRGYVPPPFEQRIIEK